MGAIDRRNKVVVEVALLLAGCAALGALLLKKEDPPPQRVQLTMTPTAPHAPRTSEPAADAPPVRDRLERPARLPAQPVPAPRASRPERQFAVAPSPEPPATPPAPKAKKPKGPPTVEREALSYVGMDPLAEAIWVDAINDPSVSANDRSDLIEDLNEDGFADPRRLTPDDVPLIVNRLALIEQLAPSAMDDVNAAAFAEAYKDLANMYARVAGLR